MEIDILHYLPVIKDVLSNMRIKQTQHEDLTQECYLALWAKIDRLKEMVGKGTDRSYASMICRNRIRDIQRSENQYWPNSPENPKVTFDTLSDPKILHRAMKIAAPIKDTFLEDLEEALTTLGYEDYKVIYNVYYEGRTQMETAADFGISRRAVRAALDRGIFALKQFFDVENSE